MKEAMSGLKIPKDKILYVEVLLYQISLSSLSDTLSTMSSILFWLP